MKFCENFLEIFRNSCGSLKVIEFEKNEKDDSTGSYTTDIQINNITKGSSKKIIVYKIKSNEPERYYVKPNCGLIKPGQFGFRDHFST